jgi:hypothetical protein
MKKGALGLYAAAVVLALAAGTGCRTSEDDVHRWADTAQGPRKLVAVLTHDKYPIDLRVEAALTLIRMKPRGGRRVGIQGTDDQKGLIEALSQMPPAGRTAVVSRLVPRLVEEMQKPPPVAQAGQPAASDPSVPYKDAAFAILTHDNGSLVPDEGLRKTLRASLAQWASTNFAERLDDSSQIYGIEQMMRELRAEGVRPLSELIAPNAPRIDRIADLIADSGDPETKLKASQKLVSVAKETNSENWLRQKAPALEAANRASKLTPKPEQFRAQLAQYQEEELLRVFSSMKKVGGKPAVDYLFTFAQDKSQSEKRRAAAMAALQGNVDRNNPTHAQQILAIAAAPDTPDNLRDVALQRVAEFPRELVVGRLYELFKNDNWKVRWVAAELVLKMSDTSHLPEFMQRIGGAENMAITEPLRYGALIADMKGKQKPEEVVDKYLTGGSIQSRLTALGYYYEVGNPSQLAKVEPSAKDNAKTPSCNEGAKDCEWKCTVQSGTSAEEKNVTTVSEFVEFCVKPAMQKRSKAGSK